MPREAIALPFVGDVDLFGKDFTIADSAVRKLQNLVPDGASNLKRRGAMTFQDVLWNAGTAYALRALDASQDNLGTDVPPIWFAPLKQGVYVALVCTGNRSELVFMQAGIGTAYSVNFNMAPPEYLPSIFWYNGSAYILIGKNDHQIGSGALVPGSPFLRVDFPENGAADPNGSTIPFSVTDCTYDNISNADVKPRLAIVMRQRTWYANFGDTGDLGCTVLVSDIDAPLTLGVNAITDRNFIVGDDGRKITGFRPVMLQGGGDPTHMAALILKRVGAWLAIGEPTETDDVDYFGTLDLTQISSKAGCVSQSSICDTDWGTIWCGPDDVWLMPFGSVPIPIGKKLRPLLKAQPQDQEFRIHAVMHDGFYRLALFSIGQGPDHSTELGEQWWLDLREGPPQSWADAKWTGPHVYKPHATLSNARVDASGNEPSTVGYRTGTSFMTKDLTSNELLGIQLALVNNYQSPHDYTPPPKLGFTLVTYDAEGARDLAGIHRPALVPWVHDHTYQIGEEIVVMENNANLHPALFRVVDVTGTQLSGAVEPNWLTAGLLTIDNEVTWYRVGYVLSPSGAYGSEILTSYHSKAYNAGTKLLNKLWDGVEYAVQLGEHQLIQVTQFVDSGKTVETISSYASAKEGPVIGSELFPLTTAARFTEEFTSLEAPSSEDLRTIGKTCQIKLDDQPGIYLPTLTFGVQIGATVYPVTLTDRFYGNAVALASAISLAMSNDATVSGLLAGPTTMTTDETYAFIALSAARAWIPGLYTAADMYMWSCIGFPFDTSRAAATLQFSTEIPSDVQIGSLAYAEAVLRFRTFKKRPTT